MSEVERELIDGVRNANNVVVDAEARTMRWIERRANLTRIAHQNGVSIETISEALEQPTSTINEWLGTSTDEPQ